MKKKIAILFFVMMLFCSMPLNAFAIEPDSLQSKSAVLIHADGGQILFEKNKDDKMAPASITKIMLLVLISEKLNSGEIALNQELTVSEYASGMGGSQVFLEANEVQSVESMLKAICMRSANDASVAVAEFLYGSEEGAAKAMNDKAIELGMKNTNFVNVTGLPVDQHYTTAYDIALMTKELLKYDYVNKYMLTWMDSILVGKEKDSEQVLVNTNRLINNYDGLLGGKTGYTNEAKYCFSAAAKRNDTTLIAVVLGVDNSKVRFAETTKLLNDGFANYKNMLFGKKGEVLKTSPIYLGKHDTFNIVCNENINYFTNSNSKKEDFNVQYVLETKLKAPISKDTIVGKMVISKDNQVLGEYDLYPEKDVEKISFIKFYSSKLLSNLIK
ncbi:MAG: D-alanyl-D-alanine carboxypeptidase [Bacillota bacterium]|nr:D-alanyl-D-alanine carboxypeptidase [Bacillota bacterium]